MLTDVPTPFLGTPLVPLTIMKGACICKGHARIGREEARRAAGQPRAQRRGLRAGRYMCVCVCVYVCVYMYIYIYICVRVMIYV